MKSIIQNSTERNWQVLDHLKCSIRLALLIFSVSKMEKPIVDSCYENIYCFLNLHYRKYKFTPENVFPSNGEGKKSV